MGKDVRCSIMISPQAKSAIARSGALSSLTLGINLLRRFTPSPFPIFSTKLELL